MTPYARQTIRIKYLHEERRESLAYIAKKMGLPYPAVRSRYHQLIEIERENAGTPAAKQNQRRKCLTCGKKFDSSWIGNRICKPCKAGKAYRSGTDFDTPAQWGR